MDCSEKLGSVGVRFASKKGVYWQADDISWHMGVPPSPFPTKKAKMRNIKGLYTGKIMNMMLCLLFSFFTMFKMQNTPFKLIMAFHEYTLHSVGNAFWHDFYLMGEMKEDGKCCEINTHGDLAVLTFIFDHKFYASRENDAEI